MAGLLLRGFTALKKALSPTKFRKRFEDEIGKATKLNALLGEGAIKEGISKGTQDGITMVANAAATKAMKGSSRPLVDSGELLKSVVGRATSWDAAVIGVLKSRSIKDKETGETRNLLQVARILHNGATIGVTEAMRRYFFWMASRYEKGEIKRKWLPLSHKTKVIVVPPRPFLEFAVTKRMVDKYTRNWEDAMQRAIDKGFVR